MSNLATVPAPIQSDAAGERVLFAVKTRPSGDYETAIKRWRERAEVMPEEERRLGYARTGLQKRRANAARLERWLLLHGAGLSAERMTEERAGLAKRRRSLARGESRLAALEAQFRARWCA
jgi:hypothetical protein